MKGGVMDFVEKPFRDRTLLDDARKTLQSDANARGQNARKTDIETKISSLTSISRKNAGLPANCQRPCHPETVQAGRRLHTRFMGQPEH